MHLFLYLSLVFSAIEEPTHLVLLKGGDDGSKFYRIPAIVMAPDNKTLVTATDKRWYNNADLPQKIDVVIKTSKDNGKTWSSSKMITPGLSDPIGYGDPALIVDHQRNAIFCLFSGDKGTFASTKDAPQRNFYCVSYDNGETWSNMVEITHMLYGKDCKDPIRREFYSNFLTSGNGFQLRNGNLMLIGAGRKYGNSSTHVFAVFSEDHGKTWTLSPHSPVGVPRTYRGDETKVMELNNGSLLMSIRQAPNRLFSLSIDGGHTWAYPTVVTDILDPNCNGDIIRYTSTRDGYNKDRIIHTIPYGKSRANLSVLISYDEGNTWPVQKVIHAGSAAYSSVTFSPIDGKIYLYWERGGGADGGYDMVVTTLTLDYLTDGKDTWTPPSR